MDDRVIRSMARWPDVPAVFGWLALDGRGRWLLKGETIANRAAVAFIARNYVHDEYGRWYFQNGPQRVFVELHAAPWIFRLVPDGAGGHRLIDHIERTVGAITAAFIDEAGMVWLDTPEGVGRIDDRDLELLSRGLLGGDGQVLDDDGVEERLDRLGVVEASAHATADAMAHVTAHAMAHAMDLAVRIDNTVLAIDFVRCACIPSRFHFVCVPQARQDEIA